MNKKRLARMKAITREDSVQNCIKKHFRKNNNIIYGARSINAQTGILLRQTEDWDAYANNPKKASKKLQKKLDKTVGGDYFFSKPAMHKGTWKVKGKGDDLLPNTKDDKEVVDFSKPSDKIHFIEIEGLKYRKLKEEIKAKKSSIADPQSSFRHKKDKKDLDRIKDNLKIKKIMK